MTDGKAPRELLASTQPTGQEPNAKAAFMRLDPQSLSVVLDRLCYAFELSRNDIKTMDDCIVAIKCKKGSNGHTDGGTPLTEVFLKEGLYELLSYVHGYSLAGNRAIDFQAAIEAAKPILRKAMRALHVWGGQSEPVATPVRLAAPAEPPMGMREPFFELLDIIFEDSAKHPGGLNGAIEMAKPILREAMQALALAKRQVVPLPEPMPRQDPLQFQTAASQRVQRAVKVLCEEVPEELWDAPSALRIMRQAIRLGAFLLSKNKAYGDSALNPVRVFSKADPAEQIRVRLDDKLSRLVRGQTGSEDALLDTVGYYILLKVAEEDSHGD